MEALMPDLKAVFREIEEVITKDEGQRGISNLVPSVEDLFKGTRSLQEGSKILLLTGFTVPECKAGESDGPLGTISLAKALEDIGKEVRIATDIYSKRIMEGLRAEKNIIGPIEVFNIQVEKKELVKLLDSFQPSHIIAIERPGKASNGRYHSMRGEDISAFVGDLEPIFDLAKQRNIPTIAIGDGGNEMGMGKIKEKGQKFIHLGEKIFATSQSDYLILSGVSNWGAYGIVAGLSLLSGVDLLQEETEEVRLLKSLIELGGVDGCSKKREMTVDGLSLGSNLDVIVQLKKIIAKTLG